MLIILASFLANDYCACKKRWRKIRKLKWSDDGHFVCVVMKKEYFPNSNMFLPCLVSCTEQFPFAVQIILQKKRMLQVFTCSVCFFWGIIWTAKANCSVQLAKHGRNMFKFGLHVLNFWSIRHILGRAFSPSSSFCPLNLPKFISKLYFFSLLKK